MDGNWERVRRTYASQQVVRETKFYTAVTVENESVLKFANRIRQLAASLKAMNVDIPQSEKEMALVNGLPEEYNALISALDTVDDDEGEHNWESVKSRVMQGEQRINMRTQIALQKSELSAKRMDILRKIAGLNIRISLKASQHLSPVAAVMTPLSALRPIRRKIRNQKIGIWIPVAVIT